MKRECLLSRHYTGEPMTLHGKPIFYSALVNELMREFKVAVFHGADDQTDHSAFTECIMVMSLIADNNLSRIAELRAMPREQRHSEVLTFALEHDEEVEQLKPIILDRLEQAKAAIVESEAGGKHP